MFLSGNFFFQLSLLEKYCPWPPPKKNMGPTTPLFQFDSTKHFRFSLNIPISFCSNIGRIRNGPYWTSRELFRTDRSIQDKIAKSLSRTYVQWVR